jgi:signal transduction histidine kinase
LGAGQDFFCKGFFLKKRQLIAMLPEQTRPGTPVILFQITKQGLQLLNGNWEDYPGLSPNRWLGISRGGWRSLVPEEYHPEVEKLALLELSESYTVVEFPIYWQDTTKWLLVFAAAVALPEGDKKVVGLAQDITHEREWSFATVTAADYDLGLKESRAEVVASSAAASQDPTESVENLCHDLSGPLTSILVNCEMLMEDDCPPPVRQRLEGIFSEAMHINHQLRSHRRV